jgi:hypothetical protein
MTLGPKKKAIPTPTRNLRTAIWNSSVARPERRDDMDNTIIPNAAIFFGSYFAASIPAGT